MHAVLSCVGAWLLRLLRLLQENRVRGRVKSRLQYYEMLADRLERDRLAAQAAGV